MSDAGSYIFTDPKLYTDAGEDLPREYGRTVAAGLYLERVEKAVTDHYNSTKDSRTAAAVFAVKSAYYAALSMANAIEDLIATRTARISTGDAKRDFITKKQQAAHRSIEAAVHAVETAYHAIRCAYNATEFYDAMWRDFNHIVAEKSFVLGTPLAEDMFVLPNEFGPMWPYGPPSDCTEYNWIEKGT